jgi:hypothetical protein
MMVRRNIQMIDHRDSSLERNVIDIAHSLGMTC